MNIVDPILVVMVALLAVNLYIALAIHEIVRTLAASKKQDTVGTFSSDYDGEDDLFDDAEVAVLEAGKCSTSLLQRKFRIGYGRAARLIDLLADDGVIEWHAKPSPGRWVVSEDYRQAKKDEEVASASA